jgi:hypothetical protein
MLEAHLHCAECLRLILLHEFTEEGELVLTEEGEPVEREVKVGQQLIVAQGPNGSIVAQPRNVPLCDDCYQRIKEQSGLVVPKPLIQRVH